MFDDSSYSQFCSDPVVNEAKDKRTRIVHICKSLKLNNLIENCVGFVGETASQHKKSKKTGRILLDKSKLAYDADSPEDIFSPIIEDLTNVCLIFTKKLFLIIVFTGNNLCAVWWEKFRGSLQFTC